MEDDKRATTPSILDHYFVRPTSTPCDDMTLLEFARQYKLPKTVGDEPTRRKKHVIMIPRPYISPDPAGPNHEKYFRQSLMQYNHFREISELLAGKETYASAYAEFLKFNSVPSCLEDDIHRLQQHTEKQTEENGNAEDEDDLEQSSSPTKTMEEWMLICQPDNDLSELGADIQSDVDWTLAAKTYQNLEEAPSFIAQQRHAAGPHTFTTSADPNNLQGKQMQVYSTVFKHFEQHDPPPFRMIVSGTAGTGKSYHPLPTNTPQRKSCNCSTHCCGSLHVDGRTLHSFLSLPTKGDLNDLKGDRLNGLQDSLSEVRYIIIDEM